MTKYIHKQNNKYVFDKRTKGKRVTISCPDLETAVDIRDIYSKHDWYLEIPEPTIFKTHKIYYVLYRPENRTKILFKTKDYCEAEDFIDSYVDLDNIKKDGNKISIMRSIKNKNTSFGNYNSLREAIKFRDLYREHDWDYTYFQKIYKSSEQQQRKYIYKARNRYVIRKNDKNGIQRTYGSFVSFEKAKERRDWLIENDWKLQSNSYITTLFGRYWIYYPNRHGGKVSRDYYNYSYDIYEIKQIRDKYVEEGFPSEPLFSTDCLRYISYTKGYGYIEKKNRGYYGNNNLLKVIDVRDILEENDWNLVDGTYDIRGNTYDVIIDADGKFKITLLNECDYADYIHKQEDKYVITHDGIDYASFEKYDDAVEICRIMLRFNWNLKLCRILTLKN